MNSFRNISNILKKAQLNTSVAAFYNYAFNNGDISLGSIGAASVFSFWNDFDFDTPLVTQLTQNVSGAYIGLFLPQIFKFLTEGSAENPVLALAIALTATTLTLDLATNLCDQLSPRPAKPRPLTFAEQKVRDAEIRKLLTAAAAEEERKTELRKAKEDEWMAETFGAGWNKS
jgi:hypothetical protein